MKAPIIISFFTLIITSTATACLKFNDLEKLIHLPPTLSFSKEYKISTKYQETKCVEFYKKQKSTSIGLLCTTNSTEFLSDFGIVIDSKNNEPSGTISSKNLPFKVNTPILSYEMSPVDGGENKYYTADVDCDEYNEDIYRPTSTCNVSIMPLKDGRYVYSNFILKNHVDSSLGASEAEIHAIWDSLKPAPDSN